MSEETTQWKAEDGQEGPSPSEKSQDPRNPWWQVVATGVLAVIVTVAVFVVAKRVDPEQLKRYGYLGVFLISMLSSATIVLPAPSLAIVSVVGAVLSPYLLGPCAGAGEAIGELTGYLAGYSGRAVVENRKNYERIVRWTEKYGLWVVFALSVIPSPLFDLAGIAAGALKIPVHKFLLVCWIGKSIKATLVALGGRSLLLPFLGQ